MPVPWRRTQAAFPVPSISPHIHSSTHPSTYPSYPSTYPRTYPSTHQFIHLPTYLPIHPPTHPPNHLHIYPSIYPPIYLSIHLLILPSITPSTLSAHLSIWWSTQENSASYFVLDPVEGLSPCPLGAPSLGEKTETNNTSPPPTQCTSCVRKEELGRRSPGKEPKAHPGIMKGFPGEESCQKASFLPCPPISSDPRTPTLCQAQGWKKQIQPALRSSEGAWVGVSMGSSAADQSPAQDSQGEPVET